MRRVKFILSQKPELGEVEVDSTVEVRYNKMQTYRPRSEEVDHLFRMKIFVVLLDKIVQIGYPIYGGSARP